MVNSIIRYLRYIYNRIILETHQVRSAAVAALARFGACVPGLKADVEELLSRCCTDSDDECRDRATFFLMLLQSSNEELISRFLLCCLCLCLYAVCHDVLCFSRAFPLIVRPGSLSTFRLSMQRPYKKQPK
jgi:hypothetical protein